jgi:hypothetical protein
VSDTKPELFPNHIEGVRKSISRTKARAKADMKPFWDKSQIHDFVNGVKHDFGPGWDIVGPRVQKAFLAEHALRVLMTQRSAVPTDAMRQLLSMMIEKAGL